MDKKKQKGITIIALIITVIIMLILLGVSVNTVINGGIFDESKEIVNEANNRILTDSEQEEQIYVDYNNEIGKPIKGGTGDGKLHPGDKAKRTANYEDENGDVAVIPGGFTVSGTDGENTIADGLVIYLITDGTTVNWSDSSAVETARRTYDQFVWIPIARENINDMYICQNKGKGSYGTDECAITVENNKAVCKTHGDCENMAGRLYAENSDENYNPNLSGQTYGQTYSKELREPDIITDYDGLYLGILNNILGTNFASITGEGTYLTDFKTYLQIEYNNIVKSIYLNEGFYVGRYETSNMVNDSTSYTEPIKVVAGRRSGIASVNWYYMYAEQVDYANKKGLNTIGSTMMQGAAYDQVLKFVNTINYDVRTAGNITHDFDTNYNTGSKSTDFSKNIYDLEGNVRAWTTEVRWSSYRIARRWLFFNSWFGKLAFSIFH